jgi:serine/threonine protein kinase
VNVEPGARFGPYEIVAAIGAGGMGQVYRARDTRLDRSVAVKLLSPAIAGDADSRVRFEREARVVAGLDHPHICGIFDVGQTGGAHFIVMPLLDGETLAARLEKGRLQLDQALRIASEIADALDAAHRHGVVHRDLKPANIMLTRSGAKLLDFGLAKLKGRAGPISMFGDGAAGNRRTGYGARAHPRHGAVHVARTGRREGPSCARSRLGQLPPGRGPRRRSSCSATRARNAGGLPPWRRPSRGRRESQVLVSAKNRNRRSAASIRYGIARCTISAEGSTPYIARPVTGPPRRRP